MPADTHVSRTLSYLRSCYQADNRALKVTDFFHKKIEEVRWVEGKESLLTGEYPQLPLDEPYGKKLVSQLQLYQREKTLFVGGLFLVGKLPEPINGSQILCAPLILYPSSAWQQDGFYYYNVDFSQRRINHPVLRSLSEDTADGVEELEQLVPHGPLDFGVVSKIVHWMSKYLPTVHSEEVLLYPQVVSSTAIAKQRHARKLAVSLLPAVGLGLIERSADTQGILSEMKDLMAKAPQELSNSLRHLLAADESHSQPPGQYSMAIDVPAVLNTDQLGACRNARMEPISVIQGPPGTGKTYTIAAIALDLVQQGQSVLIGSQNDEAVDVVAAKIAALSGDSEVIMRGGRGKHLKGLKARMQFLLHSQRRLQGEVQKLENRATKQRAKLKNYDKNCRALEKAIRKEQKLGIWTSPPYPDTAHGFQRWLYQWKGWVYRQVQARKPPLWKAAIGLLNQQKDQIQLNSLLLTQRVLRNTLRMLEHHFDAVKSLQGAIKSKRSADIITHFEKVPNRVMTGVAPIWLTNLRDIYKVLPMNREMFDVVIIDEATQCDITSAIPFFQRAKRAVVVGDIHQLRHISFLASSRQRLLAQQLALPTNQLPDYRNESLLDLAIRRLARASAIVSLQEHFRSHPTIIRFSNQRFYGGELKVMSARPYQEPSQCHLRQASGQRDAKGVNAAEAEMMLADILALIARQEYLPEEEVYSLGILSPFAHQVKHLARLLGESLSPQVLKRHQIMVGTPYTFQGGERDVMYLSWTVDDNTHPSVFPYLNRPDVFNVAITRARNEQWSYFSGTVAHLNANSLLAQYLSEIQDLAHSSLPSEHQEDPFLTEVLAALQKENLLVWPHFLLAGIQLDVVIKNPHGVFGLDLIGQPGPCQEALTLSQQAILQRAGMPIFILPYSQWVLRKRATVQAIKSFKW